MVHAFNAYYGIVKDSPFTREYKNRPLDADNSAKVADEHVRMFLRLRNAFGLRREETMKFKPRHTDRGGQFGDCSW